MAGTTESTASAILKKVYPGLIEDQLNKEVVLYATANKKKEAMVFGAGLVRAIRVNRSQGLGARGENATLPNPGNQGYAAPAVSVKRNYHVGQISGAIIRDSAADDAAFEDALAADTQYNILDLTNELDWQLFRGTGKRAQVNGSVNPTGVTFTVDNPGSNFIGVGMVIDVYSGATGQALGLTVSAVVDSVTFVIGSATGTTLSDNAYIYRAGNFNGTVLQELSGLQVIVDDTTNSNSYFGLSKATYPGLKAGSVKNSEGALTEVDMQAAIDGARQNGGGMIDMIVTSYQVRRKYSQLLTSNKRYPSPYSMSLQGGFDQAKNQENNTGSGLSFDDVEVVAAKNAPVDEMYFLDMSTFTFFEQSDIKWIENGGSVLHPLLAAQGLDAYEYSMFHEGEFYSERPSANAVIRGITIT